MVCSVPCINAATIECAYKLMLHGGSQLGEDLSLLPQVLLKQVLVEQAQWIGVQLQRLHLLMRLVVMVFL